MKPRSRSMYSITLISLFLLIAVFGISVTNAIPHSLPPGMVYREDYNMDTPRKLLIERLQKIIERREEKIENEIAELAEEQVEIQALIDARDDRQDSSMDQDQSLENNEALPKPAAVISDDADVGQNGKRVGYMSLCHFKICNMGRKRQL